MSGLGRTTSWLLQHILLWSWRRHLHCWFSCRSWWNLSVIWQALLQLIRFWNTRLSDKLNLGFISVGQDESPHILIADVALCSKAFSWTNAWLEVSKHGALHYLTLITDHHCRSINYDPSVRETHFNREYCAITNSSTLLWTPGVLLMTDRDSSDWSNNLFLHSCFGMFWLWPSESQAAHIESW